MMLQKVWFKVVLLQSTFTLEVLLETNGPGHCCWHLTFLSSDSNRWQIIWCRKKGWNEMSSLSLHLSKSKLSTRSSYSILTNKTCPEETSSLLTFLCCILLVKNYQTNELTKPHSYKIRCTECNTCNTHQKS